MSNIERECSNYVYDLSRQQLDQLLSIAREKDRPFLEVVMEAIDQYIEREKDLCQKTP